jgi:hypothetical protein
MLLAFAIVAFQGNAQSEWDKMWSDIQNSINSGSFDGSKFNLGNILDLGSLDISSILGQGGLGSLGDGGIFGSGGLFDITPGSMFGGMFGIGFDELHNDASLNSNVTWGILHTGRIHSKIKERQEKIMALQDSINLSVKRLYELEKLTVEYLNTTQSDAVEIESYHDLFNTAEDIAFFYSHSATLCDKASGLEYVKERMTLIVVTRSARMVGKVLNFARVDGNNHLLNNEDRNAIVTNLIDDMRELRGTLAYTYRSLLSGSNYQTLNEQTSIQNTINQIYKR